MNFDPRIRTESLTIAYERNIIVSELDLTIPSGEITALVGANGSGKSTILKAIGRILKVKSGHIFLDGTNLKEMATKAISKRLTILPQNPQSPRGLRVDELVAYGRAPHQTGFNHLSREDKEIIYNALDQAGVLAYAYRELESLSGGQMQRVWIALALAQQTDILLLDEPTTFLDMSYQMDVLHLLEKLNRTQQCTIVMVVHDLNHASRFSDYMVAIKDGSIVKQGTPSEVMLPNVLKDVFDIEADIIPDPRLGYPLCIPYATTRTDTGASRI
ncbi:ABC transporter ATP-binding protein [Salicibibacter cibarius]|uniref:ABC transporter ATP-binding protein n=1 Tax=Salicibibacter cibarius TaxID=2743000 RepID=A0A7T7CBS6_9BACI|nr:ABC transporter ATP-binding protein [Salicibibacter cibarius]QQK76160.1 ABC transporter ATP-binding protein [Salicibibacter cibarius]